MENKKKVSEQNETTAVETVSAPVQQKENWKTRAKNFGKKHKKGLIAGGLALLGTVIFCATRKSGDDGEFETSETTEVETEVEITDE